jgi:MoaA/NifB/PqqE/SkfB family radical SAM enzyme
LKPAPHFTCEQLAKVLAVYFNVIERVNTFSFGGGEPFLHPELPDIVRAVFKYKPQLDTLEIITNGSLPVTPAMKKVFLEYRSSMFIIIDNYRPDLSKAVQSITASLDEIQFPYKIRKYYGEDAHYGGWVDFGDGKKIWNTVDEVKANAEKCADLGSERGYLALSGDGLVTKCAHHKKLIYDGIVDKTGFGCVDFLDKILTVDELKAKTAELMDAEYTVACAYCNGLYAEAKHYPAADQLE